MPKLLRSELAVSLKNDYDQWWTRKDRAKHDDGGHLGWPLFTDRLEALLYENRVKELVGSLILLQQHRLIS